MSEQSLKSKTAKGLLWGGVGNGIMQLLNLLFGVFLSRMLSAEDYGMVGMLTIFSLIASSIQESGFTTALTNKKNATDADYNSVFWFSIVIGVLLYVILFFCAPLIASFYDTPSLTVFARYSFLGFLIASTSVAQSAYLYSHLMVKQRTMSSVIALSVAGSTGVLMAYNGFGYWSILTQNLVYVSMYTICCWSYSSWRPTFSFSIKPIKEMFGFSGRLLTTNIFNHINNNLFSVLLGRFYSSSDVGYFSQSNKWNGMGHSFVSGMLGSVTLPVLASISHDDEQRRRRVFHKMLRMTAFISFPVMLGLSLIAPELIVIAITDKWLPSVYILQVLCVSGAFIPVSHFLYTFLLSKGKSNIYMWNTVALGLLQILIALITYPYGISTMVVVYALINIAWVFVWMFFVCRIGKLKVIDILRDIFSFAIIASMVMVATYFATINIDNIYLSFILKIVIAFLLYTLIMWVSGSVIFKETIKYIYRRGKMEDLD